MGRHGGGSRSGGGGSSSRSSGGSSSSGGSRSGGNSVITSKTPFKGGYNRSYYGRFGGYHSYYTTDRFFGTKSGWNFGTIFALLFITIHMLCMVGGFTFGFVDFGRKVNGDPERIFIEDRIDILTYSEEEELIELFEKVYEKSGMPVALYTDDFSWKNHYYSLETYSEELYYNVSLEEDAMVILFTQEEIDDFLDWEYDMYCGDDTVKCLSDATFDKLLDNFQKSMAQQDLYSALTYSWNSVINDLAKISIEPSFFIVLLFFILFYGVFYVAILGSVIKENDAYRYFKKHPEELSNNNDGYNKDSFGEIKENKQTNKFCPLCNEENPADRETCKFCGHSLENDI